MHERVRYKRYRRKSERKKKYIEVTFTRKSLSAAPLPDSVGVTGEISWEIWDGLQEVIVS